MKFGVLGFGYSEFSHFEQQLLNMGHYTVNLGDNAQSIAARGLYRSLGVKDEDMVLIDRDTLPAYDGDPAFLLMNGVFLEWCFPLPASITPLFIGFCAGDSVIARNVELLRRHAPIGCRDVRTMTLVQAHGVEAYTSGCVTMMMEARASPPANPRLLVVYGSGAGDLPSSIFKHVPGALFDTADFISHRLPVGHYPLSLDQDAWIERYEEHLLSRYRGEAGLVVTSLLHVASPCIAMQIPVVLCRHDLDPRFSLLQTLLPIYTPDRVGEIDWNPSTIDITPYRNGILERARELLQGR